MTLPGGLDAPTIRGGMAAVASPTAGLQPGVELAGRYRLLELLGEGSMGVVYRARDRSLEIDIALKVLHPQLAHDPDKVAFFCNEVRVARKVTHPNVCRLHDLVEDAGGCFITMEHIAGEALSARLARGRLDLPAALRVLRDVARGLAAAHAAGVIHRDLKPSNVLLADDRAVVVDFGIAADRALAARSPEVAGTHGYMAPEQAAGAPIDARADVYALGVLALVVATERLPLAAAPRVVGDSPAELPGANLDGLGAALAELPADLAALITDCLAVPEDRPRDAREVLQRLDALAPARVEPGAQHRRAPWIIVAMLCAIASSGGRPLAGLARRGDDRPAPAATRIALPALDAETFAPRRRPDTRSDGSRTVHVRRSPGQSGELAPARGLRERPLVVHGEHMTRFAFVGLVLAVTSACGVTTTKGDDPGTGPGSDPDAGPGGSVRPAAGDWTYGEVTPVSSTCAANTPHGEDGPFAIDQVSASSFRIAPNDGTAPFTCTTSTAGFNCPDRASFVMDYRPGLSAVVTVHARATGRFSDSGHATGRQDASIDCAGTQCAAIGPLPCQFSVNFAIFAK